MDITQEAKAIAVEDNGTVVKILDANNDPALQPDGSPVTWTVCGINSEQYRKAEVWLRKQQRAIRGRDLTADEYSTMQAGFVARCSLRNAGFTDGGTPLPFTTENATTILAKLPHVRRQLEAAMGDHELFTTSASTN